MVEDDSCHYHTGAVGHHGRAGFLPVSVCLCGYGKPAVGWRTETGNVHRNGMLDTWSFEFGGLFLHCAKRKAAYSCQQSGLLWTIWRYLVHNNRTNIR
jgi:hypothetical protein